MKKILIVEDDVNINQSLKDLFVSEGYQVDQALLIADVPAHPDHDLLILDWRLPDGQGIDLLKGLREKGFRQPIILLTAKSELIDKVVGLESGANDYVTKPFEPRELLARVRAHLREQPTHETQASNIQVQDITINRSTREVQLSGSFVELTKLEYELLLLLASEVDRVFSRDEILNKVWGYENFPTTRTVDTHILQLRQKLGDHYFETIRGVGYRLKFAKT